MRCFRLLCSETLAKLATYLPNIWHDRLPNFGLGWTVIGTCFAPLERNYTHHSARSAVAVERERRMIAFIISQTPEKKENRV